ncbi:MAG: hypothetical protein CVT64_02620 [Actinobacteria bacterium HGW-Actinobacteria-4]|nr:MAG: hypothetical protein CVT64_02620 [Actinobacteria bacterium HGW-Actinobacteria-4]
MSPSTRATITAAGAAAVAGSAILGTRFLALVVFGFLVLASVGWPIFLRVSRHLVSTAIILGGGTIALVAVLLGRSEPYLRYMVLAIAAIVIAALVAEIFWPSDKDHVVTSVSATAAAGTLAASGAAWIASHRTVGSEDLVVAAAAALAVAAIASVATSRGSLNGILTLTLGAATGFGTGLLFDSITWYGGLLVGLVAASAALLINELARREPRPKNLWAGIASALTPVLASGALIYVTGRLLVG